MTKARYKYLIFIVLLFSGLILILSHSLYSAPENIDPNNLVGASLPVFSVPQLRIPSQNFTEKSLAHQVSLLHVWASWCEACQFEHPMLMTIHNTYHVPIYGIV